MNYQYFTESEINGLKVLQPYSGTFLTPEEAQVWKEMYEDETIGKLKIKRELILGDAVEELHVNHDPIQKAIKELKQFHQIDNYEEN